MLTFWWLTSQAICDSMADILTRTLGGSRAKAVSANPAFASEHHKYFAQGFGRRDFDATR